MYLAQEFLDYFSVLAQDTQGDIMGKSQDTKYKNDWNTKNLDRIPLTVPKGKKEILQQYSKTKGYKSLNAYINDLIDKDMNGSKNINVGDISQSGENNTINIG